MLYCPPKVVVPKGAVADVGVGVGVGVGVAPLTVKEPVPLKVSKVAPLPTPPKLKNLTDVSMAVTPRPPVLVLSVME